MMAKAQAMNGVDLAGLLQGYAAVQGHVPLQGLSLDSRELRPGYLFLACQGHDHHGLKHLADARARGAVAVAYDPAGAAAYLPLPADLPAAAVAIIRRYSS